MNKLLLGLIAFCLTSVGFAKSKNVHSIKADPYNLNVQVRDDGSYTYYNGRGKWWVAPIRSGYVEDGLAGDGNATNCSTTGTDLRMCCGTNGGTLLGQIGLAVLKDHYGQYWIEINGMCFDGSTVNNTSFEFNGISFSAHRSILCTAATSSNMSGARACAGYSDNGTNLIGVISYDNVATLDTWVFNVWAPIQGKPTWDVLPADF